MKTLRVKRSDGFDGIVDGKEKRRQSNANSDEKYGISKEHFNFSSAPQNAKSAL